MGWWKKGCNNRKKFLLLKRIVGGGEGVGVEEGFWLGQF